MNVLDQVAAFIKKRQGSAYCDRCLSDQLHLGTVHQNNQHANHKTRILQRRPGYRRSKDTCSLCKRTKLVIRYTG